MTLTRELYEQILAGVADMSDGETPTSVLFKCYCRDNGISNAVGMEAYRHYMILEAMSHGIPRSVAEGKDKLTDYFSQTYIDEQCNSKGIKNDGGES